MRGKRETAGEEEAGKENGREVDGAAHNWRRIGGDLPAPPPLRSPAREVLEQTEYIEMSSLTPRH
jgi:hypothetical protein